MPHDHYDHVLQATGTDGVYAVGCYGCRTMAFYKHNETALGAAAFHEEKCVRPDTWVCTLLPELPVMTP
jgi:hypothetical protein